MNTPEYRAYTGNSASVNSAPVNSAVSLFDNTRSAEERGVQFQRIQEVVRDSMSKVAQESALLAHDVALIVAAAARYEHLLTVAEQSEPRARADFANWAIYESLMHSGWQRAGVMREVVRAQAQVETLESWVALFLSYRVPSSFLTTEDLMERDDLSPSEGLRRGTTVAVLVAVLNAMQAGFTDEVSKLLCGARASREQIHWGSDDWSATLIAACGLIREGVAPELAIAMSRE